MIKSIQEMKPGEHFRVNSNEGGCKKAPCTRKILAIGETAVASDAREDQGFYYRLKMENYIGTVKTTDGMVLHQFSK